MRGYVRELYKELIYELENLNLGHSVDKQAVSQMWELMHKASYLESGLTTAEGCKALLYG